MTRERREIPRRHSENDQKVKDPEEKEDEKSVWQNLSTVLKALIDSFESQKSMFQFPQRFKKRVKKAQVVSKQAVFVKTNPINNYKSKYVMIDLCYSEYPTKKY